MRETQEIQYYEHDMMMKMIHIIETDEFSEESLKVKLIWLSFYLSEI